jgi:predicted nucleic acid-binding protein
MSTDLLILLLTDPEIKIIANDVLLDEYRRFALRLDVWDFFEFIQGVVDVVNPTEESIMKCKTYFSENEFADTVHAATCIDSDAVLISNDKHFDKIKNMKIIEVWNINEAIEKLLES